MEVKVKTVFLIKRPLEIKLEKTSGLDSGILMEYKN